MTVDQIKKLVLENVNKEVKRQGLTQAYLGELIGVRRNHVNNILKGTEESVSLKRLLQMAEVLGLEIQVKVKRIKNS